MEAEVKARLEGLEKLLRPMDLVQKVRSMILARAAAASKWRMSIAMTRKTAATLVERRGDLAIRFGPGDGERPRSIPGVAPRPCERRWPPVEVWGWSCGWNG